MHYKNLGKILIMIPARSGSKRVKNKNLRKICGKPLISYSIELAKKCFESDSIFVNSDSDEILLIANKLGVQEYKRDSVLASDEATGDDFTIDFLNSNDCETLIMINPVCPLLKKDDILNAIESFNQSDCDTLISCTSTQMQCFFEDEPVNIDIKQKLQQTQLNKPVKVLNWAITIWNSTSFKTMYKNLGYAYIGIRRNLFTIPALHGIKISTEDDFKFAEKVILLKES